MTTDRFIPPAAESLPEGALDSATEGANRLDAWALDPRGRNFLAHALVQLARDGWLRTAPAAVPVPPPADQTAEARRERYATAISKWHRDPEQPLYTQGAEAVIAIADAEQAELRRERDLAIAHDRQPYPTAWAYERACKALRTHRERADAAEEQRLSLSEALGLGTGAPWDAIRDRAAELAVLPEQTDQAAVPLTDVDRQFLTFALDLASDEMASRGAEFTAEDEAALETLRQMAAEEQPAETSTPRPADVQHMLTRMRADATTDSFTVLLGLLARWAAGSEGRDALLDDLIAAGYRLPHACGNCEGIDPDTCLMNPDRTRAAVGEQPETQETRVECAHCWREIENRSTPNMGGPTHDNWVHLPGGFTVCFPQRGGDSPRAEPRTPE